MLSPDEKTLYVTNAATIVAFDVQSDGAVANQQSTSCRCRRAGSPAARRERN